MAANRQVYIDLRSRKDRCLRAQRRINGITSELKAISEEKRLTRDLTEKLNRLEAKGARWEEVIERWFRQQELFPTRKLARTTIVDYEAMLRNWTESWLSRTASDITRADAREMFLRVDEAGRSQSFRQRLKGVINMIYLWGIEERMICGVHLSPVTGIEVLRDRGEKRPEILSIEEIRILLKNANEQKHPWYHIWVADVLTGCRIGELHQLKKSDVEIVSKEEAAEQDKLSINKKRYGFIRVRRSWNTRLKQVGPTKAGYWRTVPVSSEFYWFLTRHLNIEAKSQDDYLLPRFTD